MFIPEKINVSDSLLFMLSCREALAGIVDQSSMPLAEKGRSRDFLFNEASDYQILSLVLKGELPKNKYNAIAEQALHLELKELALFAAPFIGEQFGEEVLKSVLFEVGPLYPNYSSAVPIFEFLSVTKSKLISEINPAEELGKAAGWGAALVDRFSKNPIVKAAISDLKPGSATRDSELNKMFTGWVKKNVDKFGNNIEKVADGVKKDFMGTYKEYFQKNDSALDRFRAQKFGSGGYTKYKGTLAQLTGTETTGEKIGRKAGEWWEKVQSMAKNASDSAQQAVNNAVKQAQNWASENPGQAKAGAIIAGAALAALAIFGAYKTYKRFMSKAAKACAGNKGDERKACVKKYQMDALKAQISDLQSSSSRCAATKDPGKCKAAIASKINKLKSKAQKSMA